MIDAVRLTKLALNHGLAGALDGPSSYLMKSPPKQVPDGIAREQTEEFIRKHAGKRMLVGKKRSREGQSKTRAKPRR